MPAPVQFTITIASLPPGFSGTPQDLASAIADRLSISPSVPWSSFVNGGAQPSSDVGPWLKLGEQWKVWDPTGGTYIDATQDGSGLVAATVTLDKIATTTPKTALLFDASGRPLLASGTPGQVLTTDTNSMPGFANPPTGTYFSLQLSTNQPYTSDGSNQKVLFDTTFIAVGVTPDLANSRIPIGAGQLWYLGASLQLDNINGPTTGCTHGINIRPYQLDATAFGTIRCQSDSAPAHVGIEGSGVYYFGGAGYVDVAIATSDPTPAAHFQVNNNGGNTRFFGFRLM